MPRPRKTRFVSAYPSISSFIPKGVPQAGEVVLSVEGLEAIRLSDFEKLDQETAAGIMAVSRQTYGRILSQARSVVSEALVTGKALKVDGGTFELRGMGNCRRRRKGEGVNRMPKGTGKGRQGQGRGKGRGGCGGGQGRGRGACRSGSTGRGVSSTGQTGQGVCPTGQGRQGAGRGDVTGPVGGGRRTPDQEMD